MGNGKTASADAPKAAVLAIWSDVTAEAEAELNEWYRREHVPERLAIPEFLRGCRYRATDASIASPGSLLASRVRLGAQCAS